LSQASRGNFGGQIASNAHPRRLERTEDAMGYVIIGLYLVSALAAAAGIGSVELRR
jgi:hypothetical protein